MPYIHVNGFSLVCTCIEVRSINDISRSGGGLGRSGNVQETVVFSFAEFSNFFGKDVVKIVVTKIVCM